MSTSPSQCVTTYASPVFLGNVGLLLYSAYEHYMSQHSKKPTGQAYLFTHGTGKLASYVHLFTGAGFTW